ncbi:MAG TPA: hypothetical protein VF235_05000, partial [Actinomycetota bacterium]
IYLAALSASEMEAPVRELLALAESSGDRLSEGSAHTRLAVIAFERGDDDAIWAHADAAIAALEPLGDSAELADALRLTGWVRWRRGVPADAEPVLRRAVEIAQRVHAPVISAEATQDLAIAVSMLGRGDEAIVLIEEAYRLAKASGNLNVLMRINNNYPSTTETWTSDFARSREILLEGEELARKAGVRTNLGWILGSLGDNAAIVGDLRDAERYQREAVDLAREVASDPLLGMRLNALGYVLAGQGRLDEARGALAASERLSRANPEPQNEMPLRLSLALVAWLSGDHDGAARELAPAVESSREYHVDFLADGFVLLVRTLVELGRREEADGFRDLTREAVAPYARAMGLAVDGLLAADPREAVTLLREAAEGLGSLGVQTDRGAVLLDLARAEARAGEDGRPTLAAARELLTSVGAFGWLARADAIEAEIGGS